MTHVKICPECNMGMYWEDNGQFWLCENCMNMIASDEDDWDTDVDDDEKPSGCVACGNPAFPNCKISCNMFDD